MDDATKETAENAISLICALDAYRLRVPTMEALWTSSSFRQEKLHALLRADGLRTLIDVTTREDVKVLRSYWLGLGMKTQKCEVEQWTGVKPKGNWCPRRVNSGSTNARGLPEEDWGSEKREDIRSALGQRIHERQLKEIGERLVRAGELYGRLEGWAQNQNTLEVLGDVVAMAVVPVSSRAADETYAHLLCLKPGVFKWAWRWHGTMDKVAYEHFYEYAETLERIRCDDYRDISNGGLRTLNPYVFNTLNVLKSTGDHPAALLLGCRSGAQYPVLGHDGRIVGVIALYVPIYHFFSEYGGIEAEGGHLAPAVAAAWGTVREGDDEEKVAAAREAAAKEWKKCWGQCAMEGAETECEHRSKCLARDLLSPFRNGTDVGKTVLKHLEYFSAPGDLDSLVATVKQELLKEPYSGYGEMVTQASKATEAKEVNIEELQDLGEWIVMLQQADPPSAAFVELQRMLRLEKEDWFGKVHASLSAPNGINPGSALKVRRCLDGMVWPALRRVALEVGRDPTIVSTFAVEKSRWFEFRVIHWTFRCRFVSKMDELEAFNVYEKDAGRGEESVLGLLDGTGGEAYEAALAALKRVAAQKSEG